MSNIFSIQGATSELRPRVAKESNESSEKKMLTKHQNHRTDPIATLKAGMRTVRHHTQGWLKQDLFLSGQLVDTKEAIYAKVWADYNAQLM